MSSNLHFLETSFLPSPSSSHMLAAMWLEQEKKKKKDVAGRNKQSVVQPMVFVCVSQATFAREECYLRNHHHVCHCRRSPSNTPVPRKTHNTPHTLCVRRIPSLQGTPHLNHPPKRLPYLSVTIVSLNTIQPSPTHPPQLLHLSTFFLRTLHTHDYISFRRYSKPPLPTMSLCVHLRLASKIPSS